MEVDSEMISLARLPFLRPRLGSLRYGLSSVASSSFVHSLSLLHNVRSNSGLQSADDDAARFSSSSPQFPLQSLQHAAQSPPSVPVRVPLQYLNELNPTYYDNNYQRSDVRIDELTGDKLGKKRPQEGPQEGSTNELPSNSESSAESEAFTLEYIDAISKSHPISTTPPDLKTFKPPPITHWTGDTLDLDEITLDYEGVTNNESDGEKKKREEKKAGIY